MPLRGPNLQAEWAKPENASVFDPMYKTVARKAINLLGLNDPNQTVMGMAAPLEAPASKVASGISPFLENLFSKVPGARHAYDAAMRSQLGQVLMEREQAKAARAAAAQAELPALQALEKRSNMVPSHIPYGAAPELSTVHPNGMFLPGDKAIPQVAPSVGRMQGGSWNKLQNDPSLAMVTKFGGGQ